VCVLEGEHILQKEIFLKKIEPFFSGGRKRRRRRRRRRSISLSKHTHTHTCRWWRMVNICTQTHTHKHTGGMPLTLNCLL
jgi:hypothetical protein